MGSVTDVIFNAKVSPLFVVSKNCSVKGKGKGSSTWYSAVPRWTRAQERFTISEVHGSWLAWANDTV